MVDFTQTSTKSHYTQRASERERDRQTDRDRLTETDRETERIDRQTHTHESVCV